MTEKVLLVDDDNHILDGYRRSLSREFLLETAHGGQQALKLVAENGPYAVVMADMRMPEMDGLQLLSSIKAEWPDTVRIVLTGYADMDAAIQALNEGTLFRFLNKPCSEEGMTKALTAALLQHRLVHAEKQLLEQTLSGSIQVLTEVLSLVNPAAFGRAERARQYIHHIATSMKLPNVWQYEVAAMMSQLGCVTLVPEMIDSVYKGETLSPNEQAQYDAHPCVAYDLLSKIPRLEPIARMIQHQNQPMPSALNDDPGMADMRLVTEILRLTLAYEKLIHQGTSRNEAVHTLARQNKNFSPKFFEALVELDPNSEEGEVQTCPVGQLVEGMIIQQDVRASDGTLLVSKGQKATAPLLAKLKNLYSRHVATGDVSISPATSTLAFVKGTS
jgi:FixJ family two-component response regulator